MQAGNGGKAPGSVYAVAGLQAGTFGALLMLLWVGLASMFYLHSSFWTVPNLFASTFHGDVALRGRFAASTWSGLALYLLEYSLLAAAFAAVVRDRLRNPRTALVGILMAAGWYFLSFGLIWKRVNPLMVMYFHERPMFFGHVLYGALLGRYPGYLRRMAQRPEAPPVEVLPGSELAEPD